MAESLTSLMEVGLSFCSQHRNGRSFSEVY